jgi:aminoglycoside phosphotransferase (APT) family kinase protein
MRREARVLGALKGTDVPHPDLIAACGDVEVIGAAFYLMEPVAGFNPTVAVPEPHAGDPGMQHALGLSMADGIAALGRIDHVAVGLGDFGRGDGWLERQVERWRSQLASYAEMDGYEGPDIPGVDEVAAWLDAHRPTSWRQGIIHGDFHFANVLVRDDAGELAAIVDWELTTIGDPLLDLAHVISTWPGTSMASGTLGLPGLPSIDEVVERYADGSDRDLSHLDWYQVLACYRLGIILEGTNARADVGKAPRATGDLLHAITVGLFEQALTLIA